MEITEDEIVEKNAKFCRNCVSKALSTNQHEFTCISFGCSVIKRKNELNKTSRKKSNFSY